MFADTIKLVTVSFQPHVGTNTLKRNVKTKIATRNVLTDTLNPAVIVPVVKELVIVNLNKLKKTNLVKNIKLMRKVVWRRILFKLKVYWKALNLMALSYRGGQVAPPLNLLTIISTLKLISHYIVNF